MSSSSEIFSGSLADAIEALAGPRRRHDTKQSWLARAAENAGVKPWAIKAGWYGDPIGKKMRQQILEAAQANGRSEATKLADTLWNIVVGSDNPAPHLCRDDLAALINAARILCREARARTDKN